MKDRESTETAGGAPVLRHGKENADEELLLLRSLSTQAPASTFERFRRRSGLVQGTKMLFETQINGFWVVLDAILKRLLRSDRMESRPEVLADKERGDRA